jgi:hypothetical protein
MLKIQNNNIKATSPKNEDFLVSLYHLQYELFPFLLSNYTDQEVEVIDKISNKSKAKITVSKFDGLVQVDLDYMKSFKTSIEDGDTVELKGWKFSIVQENELLNLKINDIKK